MIDRSRTTGYLTIARPPGLVLAIAVAGCASAGSGDSDAIAESAFLPGSVYSFSVSVRGAHNYNGSRVDFTVPVSGEITIHSASSASLLSTQGSCEDDVSVGRRRYGAQIGFSCDTIRLQLTARDGGASGTVSVLVHEDYFGRGRCIDWEVNPQTGERGRCRNWEQIRSVRKRWSDATHVVVTVDRALP